MTASALLCVCLAAAPTLDVASLPREGRDEAAFVPAGAHVRFRVAGEDIDGDGFDDVALALEPKAGGPAVLVVLHGGAGGFTLWGANAKLLDPDPDYGLSDESSVHLLSGGIDVEVQSRGRRIGSTSYHFEVDRPGGPLVFAGWTDGATDPLCEEDYETRVDLRKGTLVAKTFAGHGECGALKLVHAERRRVPKRLVRFDDAP